MGVIAILYIVQSHNLIIHFILELHRPSYDNMTESKDDDNNNGIQVHLRIRPSTNPETHFHRDDIDLNNIVVKIPKNEDLINNSRSSYSFKFSSILDDKSSQKDIFRSVGIPTIKDALAGYNSTIFA